MEERYSEKSIVNLHAKIVIGGKTYSGYIEDVAREGAEYLMTCLINVPTEAQAKKITEIHFKTPSNGSKDFKSEKKAEVHFRLPSGESINLQCDVIWCLVSQHDKRTGIFGVEIINPSAQYKEFLMSLNGSCEFVGHEFKIDIDDYPCESS